MNEALIRRTLKINAAFSALGGLLMLDFAEAITRSMGSFPVLITQVVGAALVLFALDVLWVATRKTLSATFVKLIYAADVAWVLATPVVMMVFQNQLSLWGHLLLVDVAIAVLAFAWFEGKGLRQQPATA